MAIIQSEIDVNATGNSAVVGVYLSGPKATDGFAVDVRLIHRAALFKSEIPSKAIPFVFKAAHPFGRLSANVDVAIFAASVCAEGLVNGDFVSDLYLCLGTTSNHTKIRNNPNAKTFSEVC